MKQITLHLIAVLVYMLMSTSSFGLAESLTWEKQQLRKVAQSEVSFLSFIKIFDAGLYMENDYDKEDFPGEFSYALTLQYQRAIKREALINSAQDILADLHNKRALQAIEEQLDQINAFYVDVEKGDSYTLVYDPKMGTTLLFNGEPQVTIPGKAFAEIYFSIWLGEHPKTRRLKEDLLG